MDKLFLTGNVGKGGAEVRHTPSGRKVTHVSIACNRTWTNGAGQRQETTVWYKLTMWNGFGEAFAPYLTQGRTVSVVGRLEPDPKTGGPRMWQRKDGSWGASYEVTVESMTLHGKNAQDAD